MPRFRVVEDGVRRQCHAGARLCERTQCGKAERSTHMMCIRQGQGEEQIGIRVSNEITATAVVYVINQGRRWLMSSQKK